MLCSFFGDERQVKPILTSTLHNALTSEGGLVSVLGHIPISPSAQQRHRLLSGILIGALVLALVALGIAIWIAGGMKW